MYDFAVCSFLLFLMLRESYDNRQNQRACLGRKSLVSKETVLQLRYGSETLEFGIKQVDHD